MCFSAPASFVAGATLSAVGAATISKAKNKKMVPLASVPLLLGIQQGIEGMVWLSFGNAILNTIATYAFTIFSHVLWPLYMPFAVMALESDPARKRLLRFCAFIGIFFAVYQMYFIITEPVTSSVVGESIVYYSAYLFPGASLFLYVVAVCGSCFISSHRTIQLFGAVLLAALAVSYWFYTTSFFSVWCFFGAILSVIIYFHVARKR